MSNNQTIDELVSKINDTNEPVAERRAALRLLCQLRNESPAPVNQIPEEDLCQVLAAMTAWEKLGLKNLTLKDSAEAVAEGRARAKQSNQRRV